MGKIIRRLGYLLVILTVGAISVTPVMAVAQPDLEPTQIIVTTLYAGANNAVTVVVANNGDAAVSDFDVKLEAYNISANTTTVVDTKTGNSILASNNPYYWPASVKFDWTPTSSGNYTLTAIVDSADAVIVSDETNNQL